MNTCKILADRSSIDMSVFAMDEDLQTLSGVAVSYAKEPLRLVCNTGIKAIREKRRDQWTNDGVFHQY